VGPERDLAWACSESWTHSTSPSGSSAPSPSTTSSSSPAADDRAVETALRRAGLGPWLDDLTPGLATRLGDGGAAVSGGERARLAVARSLLADQSVLVLDEPTAHLDHASAT